MVKNIPEREVPPEQIFLGGTSRSGAYFTKIYHITSKRIISFKINWLRK